MDPPRERVQLNNSSFHAKQLGILLRDAAIVCVVFSAVGLAFNALRSSGIPLVATKAYDIYVPCPELLGEVLPIAPGAPELRDARTLLVDARDSKDYAAWHAPGAINVPYDYLDPIPDAVLDALSRDFASSKKARIVVYGDGEGKLGDAGHELGRELSGRGLRNVYVLQADVETFKRSVEP